MVSRKIKGRRSPYLRFVRFSGSSPSSFRWSESFGGGGSADGIIVCAGNNDVNVGISVDVVDDDTVSDVAVIGGSVGDDDDEDSSTFIFMSKLCVAVE